MDGLTFKTPPLATSDPVRLDVALFVGYVAGRPLPSRRTGEPDGVRLESGADRMERLPGWLLRWFADHDWIAARPWRPRPGGRTAEDLVSLQNVPVPIDTWEAFDGLFAWEARPLGPTGRTCDTLLGAAVRRFFAAGGRRCYVVRLGDPWSVTAPVADRRPRMDAFLPTVPPPSPGDRTSWRGLWHLFGLPDVALLCLPDLPDLFAGPGATPEPGPAETVPEVWTECAEPVFDSSETRLRGVPAPMCDADGFRSWATFVGRVGAFVERRARGVQLVAAVPRPVGAERTAGAGAARAEREASEAQWREVGRVHARTVQLAYPWVRTRASGRLPGGVEPPDALLTGLLADHALRRGAPHAAVQTPAPGVVGVTPVPDRGLLERPLPPPTGGASSLRLRDRVSVFAPAPGTRGFHVLSDVTTAGGAGSPVQDEAYRPANVYRLLATLLRAARQIGEEVVFERNGEVLWRRLREAFERFLAGMWSDGLLAGATADAAFTVRCDRSTHSAADLDAGRTVVHVSFAAAAPIVHLTVVLALDEGGSAALHMPAPDALLAAIPL